MKRITTKEDIEKKEKRNKIILGVILIIIMFGSIGGYSFLSQPTEDQTEPENEVIYNGVSFIRTANDFWTFNQGDYQFITAYNPEETVNISVPSSINLQEFSGRPLYYNGDTRTISEVYSVLQYFTTRVQEVCLENEECTKDLPTKSCNEDSLIIVKEIPDIEGESSVIKEGKCIIIQAPYGELLKSADALLFRLLEIN